MISSQEKHIIGHTLLRVTIGLLFLVSGIKKIMGPDGVIGMLGNIGFPVPTLFAWILMLSEAIFGALVLVGYKVKYTAWPLAIVLVVAWLTVTVPSEARDNGIIQGLISTNSFFHLIGIAGLVTIALSGAGKWALTKH